MLSNDSKKIVEFISDDKKINNKGFNFIIATIKNIYK